MLIPVPPSECMRAREAASERLDGELSEIETARLDAHLRGCAPCREFAGHAEAVTAELRAAPLERPAALTFEPRRRRVGTLRISSAAAAAVVLLAAGSVAIGHLGGWNSAAGDSSQLSSGESAALHRHVVKQELLALLPPADRGLAAIQGENLPS
jgi:predicted anti-sigma-YlaC factor YlaD